MFAAMLDIRRCGILFPVTRMRSFYARQQYKKLRELQELQELFCLITARAVPSNYVSRLPQMHWEIRGLYSIGLSFGSKHQKLSKTLKSATGSRPIDAIVFFSNSMLWRIARLSTIHIIDDPTRQALDSRGS